MKKYLIFSFLFGFISVNVAQTIPKNYTINKKVFGKISDLTPESNSIEYIEFNKDTIWVGTGGGLSKSTDAGKSWTNITFGEEGISALSIHNDTVWCATWHALDNAGEVLPVGSGLHYSDDGGKNWVDIPQPIDASGDSSIVYGINRIRAIPITTEVNNFTESIAFTRNTIWIASFAGELRKSNDNGKTWKRVVLPPDYLDEIKPTDTLNFTLSPSGGKLGFENNLNHRVFSISAINDSTLYVGTANGINRSTDNGISWIKFNHQNQTNPISGNFILDIEYDYANNTIWAATWKAEDQDEFYGISSSSDGGKNWQTYLAGEKCHGFSISKETTDIFAATENGVFRTRDNGISWIAAPEMIDDLTKSAIKIKKFRAVAFKKIDNTTNDIWFGSENGLAKLRETGGIWEGKWTVFLASPSSGSASESFVFPNPFSPDEESLRFKYNTNDESKKVSIRIFDFSMNLVRTVVQNVTRRISAESSPSDFWDGRDENGIIVPNGVYFYRIDIGSNQQPIFGKIIVLM